MPPEVERPCIQCRSPSRTRRRGATLPWWVSFFAKQRSHSFQFSSPSYRRAADTQQFIVYHISIDSHRYRRAADTLTQIFWEATFIVTIEGPTLPDFINILLRQSL